MNLISDLQEAKQLWAQSSWQFRGLIIFAGLLAVSPLASLADVVFEWKGFFLDGLNFYKHWVTVPIMKHASGFGLIWNQNSIDLLFLFSLQAMSHLRLNLKVPKKRKRVAWDDFLIPVPVLTLGYLLSGFNNEVVLVWGFLFICFIYLITCILIYWLESTRRMLVFCSPFLFAITTVLILGALNAGLSR